MKRVKIKNYEELKDKPWFAEEMKRYCGMETEIRCKKDDNYVWLIDTEDWQWHREGLIELGNLEKAESFEEADLISIGLNEKDWKEIEEKGILIFYNEELDKVIRIYKEK